RKTLVN
ncbi:secD/SecF GG Motif family protein, partial [Vibrio parahaemolyticus V-223/04]